MNFKDPENLVKHKKVTIDEYTFKIYERVAQDVLDLQGIIKKQKSDETVMLFYHAQTIADSLNRKRLFKISANHILKKYPIRVIIELSKAIYNLEGYVGDSKKKPETKKRSAE